jgi:hypothetical protein
MNTSNPLNLSFRKSLFSTALLPSLEYMILMLNTEEIVLEQYESFQKQNNRSRFHILSPNGLQTLHIPLKYCDGKTQITDVEIDYKTNWQLLHWRSIEAAYNRSPFFEFYKDAFEVIFFKQEKFLFQYNLALIKWLFKTLNQNQEINFTNDFDKVLFDANDFRNLSNSKNYKLVFPNYFKAEKYQQVFSHKLPFHENLSCIDLLFNTGNAAIKYLK